MKEQDIRLLISQTWQGFKRSDNQPTKGFPNIEAQQAYKAESEQIEQRGREALLDLAASSLCAIHRIADALESIAHTLEAGGPFSLMAEPKSLFAPADDLRGSDQAASERG